MKTCSVCKEEKPYSEYHKDRGKPDGYRYSCKPCTAQSMSRTHRPDGYWMKSQHGITKAQFDEMLEKQGNKCVLCPSTGPDWRIDHDHKCCNSKRSCGNCIRGILCHNCNIRLGYFEKNVDVDALTAYLSGAML